MSNSGKFMDSTPFIKPAGTTTATEATSSDHSLRQDLYFKPRTQTPENVKKYRRSVKEVPGVKQLHYGVYNDPKHYENYIHGVKTLDSEHVNDCIKGDNLSGINHFLNKIKEDKYARNQREPLGKSIIRNYNFPEKIKEEAFKFGIPTTGFYNAKDVVYSGGQMVEPEEVKTLYNKSHGLTDPGEQKKRNYTWYVDKDNHVFGKPEAMEFDGAKKSLCNDFLESQYPKTVVANKRLEDFRQATSDMVGRSKFKGTLHPSIDENHTFGAKSVLGGNWNVAKCIHGDPEEKTSKHLEPDLDLGKPTLHRSKLQNAQPKDIDPEKTFGVPSIRNDLKRGKVSVADLTNYGNEKDAFDLLYPNPHVVRGIDDPDFEEVIEKESLRDMLQKRDYTFSDAEFNIIYEITLKNFPQNEGKVSFKAFIDVMRNLKREFMKYRNLIS